PTHSPKRWEVAVMVRTVGLGARFHASTLTVEPRFKSSVEMGTVADLTIGEIAQRAGVPTSTVRYYERRELVLPDAWESGQRRYTEATLRRLVFVGMMQDAGLSLDDIVGVLGAARAGEWKAIARERLTVLDATIAELQLAREYLAGALLCRYDHPATE